MNIKSCPFHLSKDRSCIVPTLSLPCLHPHRHLSVRKYSFRRNEGKVSIVWPNGRWKEVGIRKILKTLDVKLRI